MQNHPSERLGPRVRYRSFGMSYHLKMPLDDSYKHGLKRAVISLCITNHAHQRFHFRTRRQELNSVEGGESAVTANVIEEILNIGKGLERTSTTLTNSPNSIDNTAQI